MEKKVMEKKSQEIKSWNKITVEGGEKGHRKTSDVFNNIAGKGEIARYKQLLPRKDELTLS